MKNLVKGKKGFTLIELVIVIAILGILAGIAIPRFLDATATARGARIVADLRTIDSAIVIYNAKTGSLPTAPEQITAAATTEKPNNLQLLASWPKPAIGSAIFPAQPTTTVTIVTGAAYAIENGEAKLNGNTASVLADGGTGYVAAAK